MCVDYSDTINLFTELDAYPLIRIETLVNKIAGYWVFSTFYLKSAYYELPLCEDDKEFTAFEANRCFYQFTQMPLGVTNTVATFQWIIDNTFVYLDNITVARRDQEEHDKCIKQFLEASQHQKLSQNDLKSILSTNKISVIGYEISVGLT